METNASIRSVLNAQRRLGSCRSHSVIDRWAGDIPRASLSQRLHAGRREACRTHVAFGTLGLPVRMDANASGTGPAAASKLQFTAPEPEKSILPPTRSH